MSISDRRLLITGANGFIGKNLVVRLNELPNIKVFTFVRSDDRAILRKVISQVDAVVHLAGESRPKDAAAFEEVNVGLTINLCSVIEQEFLSTGRHVPLVLSSSTQAETDSPYGKSKLAAEVAVHALAATTGNPCVIFRLPGVFGKWCKPNFNSVVATFCDSIARDLPIQINDPEVNLQLVYIDDVVSEFLRALEGLKLGCTQAKVEPEYSITVGELASQIRMFENCRETLKAERVGTGLVRALYATYVSYLPKEKFTYKIPQYADSRGVFVEMLKTADSGQFSYFTAHPGVTRGGHYHHTKTEKFLVIKGEAQFRFRHLLTNKLVELRTDGTTPQVVQTIPGWVHNITNVGDDALVVMVWTNENFDRDNPDTIACKV